MSLSLACLIGACMHIFVCVLIKNCRPVIAG
jgi:hypothetical protein